jgi:hypothetical protein
MVGHRTVTPWSASSVKVRILPSPPRRLRVRMLCLYTAYKAMGILSLALRLIGIKTHEDWLTTVES